MVAGSVLLGFLTGAALVTLLSITYRCTVTVNYSLPVTHLCACLSLFFLFCLSFYRHAFNVTVFLE